MAGPPSTTTLSPGRAVRFSTCIGRTWPILIALRLESASCFMLLRASGAVQQAKQLLYVFDASSAQRGAFVHLLFKLRRLPTYGPPFEHLNADPRTRFNTTLVPDPEQQQASYEACRRGEVPEHPPVGMQIPTMMDPSLAPEGFHIATTYGFFFPCEAPREDRGRLRDEMAEMLQSVRVPLLIVSHDVHECFLICDYAYLISNGRIVAHGSPDELKRAVNAAMDSGKPTLINAVIDPAAGSESGRIGNLNPQSALKKKSA